MWLQIALKSTRDKHAPRCRNCKELDTSKPNGGTGVKVRKPKKNEKIPWKLTYGGNMRKIVIPRAKGLG